MKFSVRTVLFVANLFVVARQLQSARILAVIPMPPFSHQISAKPLWVELNKRGHEIVLITSNPLPNMNLTNFTQIDIGESHYANGEINFVEVRFNRVSVVKFLTDYVPSLRDALVHRLLNHTQVRKLYAPNSDVKFDVVIAEMLFMPAIYAFAHRFNAPLIGFTSLGIAAINEHVLGGLVLPSHEGTWEMEANTGSDLPFWKRLRNYVTFWHYLYVYYRDFYPGQQKIAEEYFGNIPSLLEIQKNTSLVFVNQMEGLAAAKPKLPNMISYNPSYFNENPKSLPQDLKQFVDDATNGFVYFSLGGNAMSSHLTSETVQLFLDVFARLPYRVVWKYERELPTKPDNVYIAPWFSQLSILSHANIRLFVYQGGLQSSGEAIQCEVPVLGLPLIVDQEYQIGRMKALGVGERLDITTVTRNELERTILEIINNKKYKKKMIELKNIVNDIPYNSIEHLAWWTEYVIRHRGAPHLRSSLAKQPWYQRHDNDFVIFLVILTWVWVIGLIVAGNYSINRVFR
ncbi:UDP-glucosyltransferase 2-like [Hylaeus anthracinus]|uniref:UDP-glucosyltransferase 2-like n=1 Tax=Hylaeus anthracinus TaxID=313031 RepID=UPI0023B99458|nr:UDP-glucosyltransferase 2-like [Hylaeus anthracinus]